MKKTINMKLSMSEIIFDVQNKTYLTGKALDNNSNYAHVANMQANDDDENADQVLRSITMAVAQLRNRLAEYLDQSLSSSNNELLPDGEDIQFPLVMPSNYNSSAATALGAAAHQFIVATAIADWFAIMAKGETADYKVMADAALAVLEETLCKRSRPVRGRAEG